MTTIGPHAYVYLRHPFLSSGETMLYHTILHLCFTGALKLQYWRVAAHPRNPHMVLRLFMSRAPVPGPLSAAETFALDLFPTDQAISLAQLRTGMNKEIEDFEKFKFDPMRKDLRSAGLLWSTYFRTEAGRLACREVNAVVETLQTDIDTLLENDTERLSRYLDALRSNVVLLDEDTRYKLKRHVGKDPDVTAIFSILTYLESGGVFANPSSLGLSIGGSFGGGGGGGGGGFGGFGGGGFGGGGAGGSW
jgi:uncharacterized membrane protein YgcG